MLSLLLKNMLMSLFETLAMIKMSHHSSSTVGELIILSPAEFVRLLSYKEMSSV